MDMAITNTALMPVEKGGILQTNIVLENEINIEQELAGTYTGCSNYSRTYNTVHDAFKWAQ